MRKVAYEVKGENIDTFYVSTYQEALKFEKEEEKYKVKAVLIPTDAKEQGIKEWKQENIDFELITAIEK